MAVQDSSDSLSVLSRPSSDAISYISKSDASSTTCYVPSTIGKADSLKRKSFGSATSSDSDIEPSSDAPRSYIYKLPSRSDLNKALGDDIIPQTTEIDSIPCAGVRITQGNLKGLIAWRFVVRLDEPEGRPYSGIVTNFILDTMSPNSPVPPETLKALGYKGSLTPGAEVKLVVQGVRTRCVVGQPGEAGRLCVGFIIAGSLTFYVDAALDAPVLYVADENVNAPRPRSETIPRTVTLKARFRDTIISMMRLGGLPSSRDVAGTGKT